MAEAMYSIKTLITSQKLSVAATRTDAKTGKLSVDEYTVYGPVVVMVSRIQRQCSRGYIAYTSMSLLSIQIP